MNILEKTRWRLNDFRLSLRVLTAKSLFNYYVALLFAKTHVSVKVRGIDRYVTIRAKNKIDRDVLEYVFFNRYHLPPPEFVIAPDAVIVDLGSNIGCTVVDLKKRYPRAKVFAYEMHPENFELARINTQDLEDVHLFNLAVWITRGSVAFKKENLSDAFSVNKDTAANEEMITVPSVSMADIIKDNKLDKIDFIKIDIEGAEIEIFESEDLNWLNTVQSMNIEFHGVSDSKLHHYIKLLEQYSFKVYKSRFHWLSILAYKP